MYWRSQKAWDDLWATIDDLTQDPDAETALLAREARDALDAHRKAEIAYEAAAHNVSMVMIRCPLASAELARLAQIARLETARVRFERSLDIVDAIVRRYGGDPIYEVLPVGAPSFALIDDDGELPF